jgi:PhnB protein
MRLNAYLTFDGQCEAAFRFYQRCLGGKITTMLTWGESPMAEQAPTEWQDKILHATLSVGDAILQGADSFPGQHEETKGFSVMIGVEDPTVAERLFHTLSENGTVRMPIQQTFWAVRFGMLVDQFGIPWMVNCGQAASEK